MSTPIDNAISSQVNPKRDALIVGLGVLAASLISNFSVYFVSSEGLLEEVQNNLSDMASVAAMVTDGDLHRTLIRPDQKDSQDYKKLQEPYRMLLKADTDLRFIYTLILKDEKVFFITDLAAEDVGSDKDITRKSTANIMEEYPDTTDAMMEALRDRKTVIEDRAYADEWGVFISGYAPIYTRDHNFLGIVGVDMDARDFNHRMFKVNLALALGSIVSVLFSIAIGWALFHARSQHSVRSISRQRQLEQSNAFHSHIQKLVTELSDNLEKILRKINHIAEIADSSAEKTRDARNTIRGASSSYESISGAVERLLQVIHSLSYAIEQTTGASHGMAELLGKLDTTSAAQIKGFIDTIEELSKHSQGVLVEQKEVVGYIGEDIKDVAERTAKVVDMVYAISEMATITGQQTFNARKSILALNEQTVILKKEVDNFLKQING